MAGSSSARRREYATLVAELRALDKDIAATREAAKQALNPHGLDLHRDMPSRPQPARPGERVRLRDGGEIVIQAVEPADRDELARGFEHLSAMSRLQRFREPIDHLSERRLTELVNLDHRSHEALGARDAVTGEGVGIARYDRDPDDPKLAEFACTVLDQWQRRGVGGALIERLAVRARANGIERFKAVILVGNDAGRHLLAHVAEELAEDRDGGTIDIVGRARTTAAGEQQPSDPPPSEPAERHWWTRLRRHRRDR